MCQPNPLEQSSKHFFVLSLNFLICEMVLLNS